MQVLAYHPMLHCFKEMVSEGSDLKMQHLEFLWEQGCVMTVRCSLSLQKHTGNHNTFLGRQTGDGREHLMSRVLTGLPFLSLTHVSAWAHSCIDSPPWSESEVCTGQQALISILLSFTPSVSSTTIFPQPTYPGCVTLAAVQIYIYFFLIRVIDSKGDTFFSYTYCIIMHYTCLNSGDSQITIPELACSSLGARAANQRLWWEQKDSFKLHPSQSTAGAHESVTSCHFSELRKPAGLHWQHPAFPLRHQLHHLRLKPSYDFLY